MGNSVETVYLNLCASTAVVTNAVVASCIVLVPGAAVGAVGIPVNAGLALDANGSVAIVTNWVVAICVVLAPMVEVGAAGIPVNVGLAIVASGEMATAMLAST
jgi:hypothetical protein